MWSDPFRKLEPNGTEENFYWKLFWKCLKEFKGIACDSLRKSNKKSFLIKCILESLLVLELLRHRKLNIYKLAWCIGCDAKETEDIKHLANVKLMKVFGFRQKHW